jgi:hypothetical protein
MKKSTDWLDERIHLGEVPSRLSGPAFERRQDVGFEPAQAALEESDRQILSQIPPDRFAAEVERRRRGRKNLASAGRSLSKPAKGLWGSVAIAGLAGLIFLSPNHIVMRMENPAGSRPIPSGTSRGEPISSESVAGGRLGGGPASSISMQPDAPTDKDWRSKGEVDLILQTEKDGSLQPVTGSGTYAPGTRLRLSIPDSLPWAAVYSIDTRGEMAQHWPLAGDTARPLRQGMLPRSWELDDTPGKETFVLVWSDKPFHLEWLRKAIFVDRVHPRVGSGLRVKVVQVSRPEPVAK